MMGKPRWLLTGARRDVLADPTGHEVAIGCGSAFLGAPHGASNALLEVTKRACARCGAVVATEAFWVRATQSSPESGCCSWPAGARRHRDRSDVVLRVCRLTPLPPLLGSEGWQPRRSGRPAGPRADAARRVWGAACPDGQRRQPQASMRPERALCRSGACSRGGASRLRAMYRVLRYSGHGGETSVRKLRAKRPSWRSVRACKSVRRRSWLAVPGRVAV